MKDQQKARVLIQPAKTQRKTIDGKEVTLEELESLCGTFDRRPRGCNAEAEAGFSSTGDNDDVLF